MAEDGTAPGGWDAALRGEVAYLYAYDVAYDMHRDPLSLDRLLAAPIERIGVDRSKRHPQRLPSSLQAQVRLPAIVIDAGVRGPVEAAVTLKILPIGAVAITVRVPVFGADFADLVAFHDLHVGGATLDQVVRDIAQRALDELRPLCVRPFDHLPEEEPYTVFCLAPPATAAGAPFDAQTWLERTRPLVAALLTQESEPALLSRQEVDESTTRALSYYRHDLAVIDWDAALVVDEPSMFEQALWVLELANVQLTELEAYDNLLDSATERAYTDLRSRTGTGRSSVLREIAELRIDLARLSDELQNIGKLYGDWHLARMHQAIGDRLHLVEWHRMIDAKLTTLDELYQFLKQERMNRWMLGLEITIVLLFIADLALIFVGHR